MLPVWQAKDANWKNSSSNKGGRTLTPCFLNSSRVLQNRLFISPKTGPHLPSSSLFSLQTCLSPGLSLLFTSRPYPPSSCGGAAILHWATRIEWQHGTSGRWPQIGHLPMKSAPLVMAITKVIADNKILTQNHLISSILLFVVNPKQTKSKKYCKRKMSPHSLFVPSRLTREEYVEWP